MLETQSNQLLKKTCAGSASSSIVDINCNLFLLSEIEIFGNTTYSRDGEGTQYVYWQQHNNNDDRRKGTQSNPTNYDWWWERSPYVTGTIHFCRVLHDGTPGGNYANYFSGVSFAFCI